MPQLFGGTAAHSSPPKKTVEGLKCVEPGCDGTLVITDSHLGWYYRCDQGECFGALPANKDGSPRGRPRTRELQGARKAAHAAFDPIWQSGQVKRSTAYRWLSEVMGLEPEETHMFCMSVEQCHRVGKLVVEKGPGTVFWDRWWASLPPKVKRPPKRRKR